MVHITNGGAVAEEIRRWAGEPRLIVWCDALHDGPLPDGVVPAQGRDRLTGVLAKFARRSVQDHIAELRRALAEVNPAEDPETYQALQLEIRRLLSRGLRPLGSTSGSTR